MRLHERVIEQGIRYKPLFLTFTALFMIGMLGGYFIISTQQKALHQQFYQSGTTLANSIIRSLEHDMGMGQSKYIEETLVNFANNREIVEATVISRTMQVYASSDTSLTGTVVADSGIARIMSTGETIIRSEETGNRDIVSIIVPLNNQTSCQRCHDSNTGILGTVVLRLSTTGI